MADPTAQLSKFAQMLACSQSSVDIKAAYMGLPILYVNDSSYASPLREVTELASTPEQVRAAVTKILDAPKKPNLAGIGLPQNGSEKIAEFVIAAIKS